MKTIHKHILFGDSGYCTTVRVSMYSKLLSVQLQEARFIPPGIPDPDFTPCICAWFLVDDGDMDKDQSLEFVVIGTGGDAGVLANHRHIATVQRRGVVLHVFMGQGK